MQAVTNIKGDFLSVYIFIEYRRNYREKLKAIGSTQCHVAAA